MVEQSAWSESSSSDQEKTRQDRQIIRESNEPESPKYIIKFEENDPNNPLNWSTTKKMLVLTSVTNAINNANLGSTLATGVDSISKQFNITNKVLITIPTSLYMLGYVIGPTIAGPMSERYGRRIVLNIAFTLYTIFALACVGAPNFAALAIFRLFMGMGAAVPLSIIGGTCADMFDDTIRRGRGLAFFITAAGFGPAIGPITSGYLSKKSWRLPFWVASGIAIGSLLLLLITPETYGPAILKRKAQKIRKDGKPNVFAEVELQESSITQRVKELCIKPPKMFVTELLVLCSCTFMAFVYGVFYIFFQAYHRVYEDGYHLTPGEAGLTFISLGIGGVFGFIIYLLYDRRLRKLERNGALNSEHREETLRLPLACIGAPLLVLALFWTGASASRPQSVHWVIPVLALILFGAGYMLIFTALCNYIVDSYAKYAASAMAAATATRSLMAAVLPLCSGAMYDKLGIQWGFHLLGFVMLGLGTVPFVFLKYGNRIRERSSICQQLKREKEAENDGIVKA